MLSKLFKHEFKYYSKIYLFFYIFMAIVALALRALMEIFDIVNEFDTSGAVPMLLVGFVSLVFTLSLSGCTLFSNFAGIVRFQKNMFSSEGYLTNTLPVPTYYHIICKLSTTAVFYVLTSLICPIIYQLAFNEEDFSLASIFVGYGSYVEEGELLYAVSEFISSFASFCAFMLMSYFCLSVRCSARIGTFVTILLALGLLILNIFGLAMITAVLSSSPEAEELGYYEYSIIQNFVSAGYYLVISVGLFFLTNYHISRKLNLE